MDGEEQTRGQDAAAVAHHVTFVPVDLKVNIFTGMTSSPNDPSVEEWVADMASMLKTWNTPKEQQPQLLLRYLAGEAKREILVMGEEERSQAANIFARLLEVYGDKVSAATLLEAFHGRRQRPAESIREFALALQEILGRLSRRDPGAVNRPDQLLRDRFLTGLHNPEVQRMIKMELRRRPEMTFRDVMGEALHLMSDQELCAGVHVAKASPASPPHSEMESLKSALEETIKQQREMASIMAAMRSELEGIRLGNVHQARRPRRQPQWDESGNPICLRCDQPGHMARECPRRRPTAAGTSAPSPSVRPALN